ncbi:hypothetical protein Syun_014699 [Stephania yunnanensis]|uniref:Uncharacterized protein n=1 Tax=Stephania yunnanensis TaxID=152371 RepID=A0AAP0P9V3_9MAGN
MNLEEIVTFINSRQEFVIESNENLVEEMLLSKETCDEPYEEVEKPNQEDCNFIIILEQYNSLNHVIEEIHIEDIMQ